MPLNDYKIGDLYLKAGSWFVGHKYFFRKWWVIVILSADLLMIFYIFINGFIFAFERPKYNKMMADMVAGFISQTYRQQAKPAGLETLITKAISLGSGNYDLVAKIKNPNEDWGIKTLNYKFTVKDAETKPAESYLLPGEEKYLISQNFSLPDSSALKDLKLEISDFNWERLTDKKVLADLDFSVEEKKLTNTISNSGNATLLTAKVINRSLYDFWKVEVPIVLLSSGEPIAVSNYILRTLTSYESENISVSWLKSLPLSAQIEINPSANIFQASNFMVR